MRFVYALGGHGVFKWRVIVVAVALLCARTLPGCGKSAEKVMQEKRVPLEVAGGKAPRFAGEEIRFWFGRINGQQIFGALLR